MKRSFALILSILLISVLLIPNAFASDKEYVRDDSGVFRFSRKDLKVLDDYAAELSDEFDLDVLVYFPESLGGKSARAFADDFFDYEGYGRGSQYSGILLVIAPNEREYWISTHGEGIEYFTESRLDTLESRVKTYLYQDDWQSAAAVYLTTCRECLEAGKPEAPQPRSPLANIIPSILGGFLLAFAPVSSEKNKLKSVKSAGSAFNYVPDDGIRMDINNDVLVNHLVTRRRIQTQSSSGGSRTHTSSSGRTHGGRGGHF